MGHPMEFVPQLKTDGLALIYDVHPENHLMALQQVVDMIRSPVQDVLIEKAKESWDEPPSRVVAEHGSFTPDDRLILDALHLALRRTRHYSADPYSSVATSIIKRIGLYTQRVVDDVCLAVFDRVRGDGPMGGYDQPKERIASGPDARQGLAAYQGPIVETLKSLSH